MSSIGCHASFVFGASGHSHAGSTIDFSLSRRNRQKDYPQRSRTKKQDFYLGVQAALAAISAAFLYTFELLRGLQPLVHSNRPIPAWLYIGMLTTAVFIIGAFCLLLIVLSLHQDWEDAKYNSDPVQFKKLGIFANGIGLGLLAAFILFVKTV